MVISLAKPPRGEFVVDAICTITIDVNVCNSKHLTGKNKKKH